MCSLRAAAHPQDRRTHRAGRRLSWLATQADPLTPYDWNGGEVRLHGRCEAAWFDAESRR